MKKPCHKYSRAELFSYAYGALEPGKKREMALHIRTCPECKSNLKKVLNVKFVLKNTPQLSFDDSADLIIGKAAEREHEPTAYDRFRERWSRLREDLGYFLRLHFRPEYALITALLLLAGTGFFFLNHEPGRIYLTKISGQVHVDRVPFFPLHRYEYPLSKGLQVKTGNGECVLQIKKDRLIVLKPDTEIHVRPGKGSVLELKEGSILCSVKKLKKADHFSVHADEVTMNIIGTKFFVDKRKGSFELGVKEGRISTQYKEKLLILTNCQVFRLMSGRISLRKLDRREEECFSLLHESRLIDDFSGTVKLVIQGTPPDCDVYEQYRRLSRTPLFVISPPDQRESLYVVRQDFETAQVDRNRSGVHEYSLKGIKAPVLGFKYRLPGAIEQRPVRIDDHLLLPGLNGVLTKYDIKENKIAWSYRTGNRISTTPVFEKNIIYFASHDQYFYAVDFITGELIWKQKVGTVVYSQPVLYDQRLYFGSSTGILYCLDAQNGKAVWTMRFNKGFYSPAAVSRDVLYIGNSDGTLYACSIREKKIVWKFRTRGRIISSKPLLKDQSIYFGSNDRFLYCLDQKNGRLKWKFDSGSEIFTSPVPLEDLVLVSSVRGTVQALQAQTGSPVWKYQTKGKILLDPVPASKGLICIGDKQDNIYLLNRFGLIHSKFKYDFITYTVFSNNLLIFDKNNYLYNFLFN
ncbi:MAG: PQQ-binding-like beta-propeller repeat protein [bacterium]|nr:PQQ-binding-like beta-propeller repeat protein [bacterium]